jgi:hypothetical protein
VVSASPHRHERPRDTAARATLDCVMSWLVGALLVIAAIVLVYIQVQ